MISPFGLWIILRHLIFRGTKMGPQSWELPNMKEVLTVAVVAEFMLPFGVSHGSSCPVGRFPSWVGIRSGSLLQCGPDLFYHLSHNLNSLKVVI